MKGTRICHNTDLISTKDFKITSIFVKFLSHYLKKYAWYMIIFYAIKSLEYSFTLEIIDNIFEIVLTNIYLFFCIC